MVFNIHLKLEKVDENFHEGNNNVEVRSIQICPCEQLIPESKPNPSSLTDALVSDITLVPQKQVYN